ncbi:MAG TPA: methyltransferase domain-containing protein [Terracidiphilus sp.]|nr:methyltransferase domain-containing protein [Terracidiphilus sp.]
MSAATTISPSLSEMNQLKARLKWTWMAGDYDIFSRYMEPDAFLFYRRIGMQPGQHILDVGCGSGQLALIAARGGAHATGCDIAVNWLERARDRAAEEQLSVSFDEGDAEALPYRDGEFDVVASLFGAMFAPQPDLVASEMIRVCRTGGKIAMANWTEHGFVGQMLKTISKYIAPNGMPSPLAWGDPAVIFERMSEGTLDIKCTYRFHQFEYPFPPDVVVDFFRQNYGPMARAFESLSAEGQQKLRAELIALWSGNNRAEGRRTIVDAEYLEVIAHRGELNSMPSPIRSSDRRTANRRAEMLADRIEEGAMRLLEFAARMTEEEWTTPMMESGKPGRSAGVVVHHVASVYPIEVELAETIASGKAITQVTWDAVHQMNAQHAMDNISVSREETLILLRKNSLAAAARVRELTDAQLDRAAPFSLSFGAPITAQFVLEDHAVRHSWHHLARIRKVVDRPMPTPTSHLR